MSTTTNKLGLIKLDLSDSADITALNANWDKIEEALGGLANPQYHHYELYEYLWEGDEAPYTYMIPEYYGKTVEVIEVMDMTLEQLEAIEKAKIKSNPAVPENILYAFGEKPTIDIPVMLVVR